MKAIGTGSPHSIGDFASGARARCTSIPGGAEVDLSVIFADVRGSTGIAERMEPEELSRLMSRFYSAAADAIALSGPGSPRRSRSDTRARPLGRGPEG
jgi:hypothetical protein